MRIEKSFTVAAPQHVVWSFITDPDRVAACIPGCENVTTIDEGTYSATIKIAAGPIKTSFQLTVTATEERAPEFAAYQTHGEEGGKASRLSAKSTLTLTSIDAVSCNVAYVSEITIAGRLGKFGAGVMRKIADSEGAKFAAALGAAIEASDS
jgi:carbon monoxide dehydrogenase subunit G